MNHDNPFSSDQDDGAKPEPAWVTVILWLLPVPIIAFLAMSTVATVSIICFLIASVEQSPIGLALGILPPPAPSASCRTGIAAIREFGTSADASNRRSVDFDLLMDVDDWHSRL